VLHSILPFLKPPTGIRLSRYFRRNEGTTDYATIPNAQLSGDVVIEFDIFAPAQDDNNAISFRNDTSLNTFGIASGRDINGTSAKLRLFTSAVPVIDATSTMDVFDSIFHKIRFEFTDSTNSCRVLVDGVEGISPRTLGYDFSQNDVITLWRDVTTGDEMNGIIANVKFFEGGVLVRDYPVGDNSSNLKELVSGEDGTVINGTSDQWKLYQQQATGEWLGQEQVVNGGFDTDSDWSKSGATISGGAANFSAPDQFIRQTFLALSTTYKINYTVLSSNKTNGLFTGRGGSVLTVLLPSGIGTQEVTSTTASTGSGGALDFYISATSDGFIGSLDNVSVKEVLNVV
jgi:hypothetical protein